MLGGIMGPMVEAEAVTAAEKRGEKPVRVMAGISTEPVPAASATAEPDMPAMIMLVTTTTCPRPPVRCPTKALASRTNRSVIPPLFIRAPARMKKGTASRGKESTPVTTRWAITS